MIDFIISKLLASPNRFLSPIEEAALILECAIDGQKLQDETVTEKIRFCYRWRKKLHNLFRFAAWGILILHIFERPIWTFRRSDDSWKDGAIYPSYQMSYMPLLASTLLGIMFLLLLWSAVVLELGYHGKARHRKMTQTFALILSLHSCSLIMQLIYCLVGTGVLFNTSPIATFFVVLIERKYDRHVGYILRLLPRFLLLLVLVTFTVSLFTIAAFLLFSPRKEEAMQFFPDFGTGMWNMLMVLNGSNWPIPMMPAFNQNRAFALFFYIYIMIGDWVVLNIVLGFVYLFFKLEQNQIVHRERELSDSLHTRAFQLLDEYNSGVLTYDKVDKLLVEVYSGYEYTLQQPDAFERHTLLLQLDEEQAGYITAQSFRRIHEMCLGPALRILRAKMMKVQRFVSVVRDTPSASLSFVNTNNSNRQSSVRRSTNDINSHNISQRLLGSLSLNMQLLSPQPTQTVDANIDNSMSGNVGVSAETEVNASETDETRLKSISVAASAYSRLDNRIVDHLLLSNNAAERNASASHLPSFNILHNNDTRHMSNGLTIDANDRPFLLRVCPGCKHWLSRGAMYIDSFPFDLFCDTLIDILGVLALCEVDCGKPVSHLLFVLCCCIEMICKLSVKGVFRYYKSFRNSVDGMLTVIIVLLMATTRHDGDTLPVFCNNFALQSMVLVRVVLWPRNIVMSPVFARYRQTHRLAFSYAFQSASEFSFLLLCLLVLLYGFAALGQQLFGGMIIKTGETGDKISASEYGESGYWPLNFNDMPSGLVTMFVLLHVNNMHVTTSGFVAAYNTWAEVFFACFYAIGVLFMLNIVTAVIINQFVGYLETLRKQQEAQTAQILNETVVLEKTEDQDTIVADINPMTMSQATSDKPQLDGNASNDSPSSEIGTSASASSLQKRPSLYINKTPLSPSSASSVQPFSQSIFADQQKRNDLSRLIEANTPTVQSQHLVAMASDPRDTISPKNNPNTPNPNLKRFQWESKPSGTSATQHQSALSQSLAQQKVHSDGLKQPLIIPPEEGGSDGYKSQYGSVTNNETGGVFNPLLNSAINETLRTSLNNKPNETVNKMEFSYKSETDVDIDDENDDFSSEGDSNDDLNDLLMTGLDSEPDDNDNDHGDTHLTTKYSDIEEQQRSRNSHSHSHSFIIHSHNPDNTDNNNNNNDNVLDTTAFSDGMDPIVIGLALQDMPLTHPRHSQSTQNNDHKPKTPLYTRDTETTTPPDQLQDTDRDTQTWSQWMYDIDPHISRLQKAAVLIQFAREGSQKVLHGSARALFCYKYRTKMATVLRVAAAVYALLRFFSRPLWTYENKYDHNSDWRDTDVYPRSGVPFLSSSSEAAVKLPLLCVLCLGLLLEIGYKETLDRAFFTFSNFKTLSASRVCRVLLLLYVLFTVCLLSVCLAVLSQSRHTPGHIYERAAARAVSISSIGAMLFVLWFNRRSNTKLKIIVRILPRLFFMLLLLFLLVLVFAGFGPIIFHVHNDTHDTHNDNNDVYYDTVRFNGTHSDDTSVSGGVSRLLQSTLSLVPFSLPTGSTSAPLYATNSTSVAADDDTYFSSFSDATWSIFVAITSSSYPNQIMPAYRRFREIAIYFVGFISLGAFLTLNLVMVVVLVEFQKHAQSVADTLKANRRILLMRAFALLATPLSVSRHDINTEEGVSRDTSMLIVSRDTILSLLDLLRDQYGDFARAGIPKGEARHVLYEILDIDNDGFINLSDFLFLLDVVRIKLDILDQPFHQQDKEKHETAGRDTPSFTGWMKAVTQRCVAIAHSRVADIVVDVSCGVLILTSLCLNYRDLYNISVSSEAIYLCVTAICVAQMLFKMGFLGVSESLRSFRAKFDMCVACGLCVAMVADIITVSYYRDTPDQGSVNEVVTGWILLARCLMLIKLIVTPRNLRAIFVLLSRHRMTQQRELKRLSPIDSGTNTVHTSETSTANKQQQLSKDLKRFKKYQKLIAALSRLLRRILSKTLTLGIVFLCVGYLFASFGEIFFGGAISYTLTQTNPDFASSTYVQNGLFTLNFNDFASACLTLFCCLKVSDFDVVTSGFATSVNQSGARVFFAAWYILGVLLLLNVVKSFFLGEFLTLFTGKSLTNNNNNNNNNVAGNVADNRTNAKTNNADNSNADKNTERLLGRKLQRSLSLRSDNSHSRNNSFNNGINNFNFNNNNVKNNSSSFILDAPYHSGYDNFNVNFNNTHSDSNTLNTNKTVSGSNNNNNVARFRPNSINNTINRDKHSLLISNYNNNNNAKNSIFNDNDKNSDKNNDKSKRLHDTLQKTDSKKAFQVKSAMKMLDDMIVDDDTPHDTPHDTPPDTTNDVSQNRNDTHTVTRDTDTFAPSFVQGHVSLPATLPQTPPHVVGFKAQMTLGNSRALTEEETQKLRLRVRRLSHQQHQQQHTVSPSHDTPV